VIPPRILIIAGSDSGGGAGIQADIKAVTMMGGHAMTAITAITAQNTLGVESVLPVPTAMVLAQIDAVVTDLGVDAVKIGMIGSAETAVAVAERIERLKAVSGEAGMPRGSGLRGGDKLPIVFDPVMVASSGSSLADEATIAAFERLMAVATLVTPNAPELAVLSSQDISGRDDLEAAALALASRMGISVMAKGAHLDSSVVEDLLVDIGGEIHRWQSHRIETLNTHGTGCTLASGIACGLGQGRTLADAADRARSYVQAAILAAPGFGRGHGPLGHSLGTVPFNLIHNKIP
jgi:hydroxymethylpyrimidine/phosphomethylpyrimidine kinase